MSIFRNRLLSTIVGSKKKWIEIGEYHPSDVSKSRYRRIYQSVPLDRKVYAVATNGDTIGRYRYFTHVMFSNVPVDINNYTTASVDGQFTAKKYSEENNVFDINVYNTSFSKKGTYRTKTNPSDEWSDDSIFALLPTETIETESGQLSCHVYYFDKPLFLNKIQAATSVENIYILIDEKPEPQKFALFV